MSLIILMPNFFVVLFYFHVAVFELIIFIFITDDINMQFSYELEKKFLTWTRNPECQGSSPIQVRNLESL